MYLEIITPDEKLFEGEVSAVTLPGTEGSFQILQNHASIVSALSKGNVKYNNTDGESLVEINGGVLEFSNNKAIVLAE